MSHLYQRVHSFSFPFQNFALHSGPVLLLPGTGHVWNDGIFTKPLCCDTNIINPIVKERHERDQLGLFPHLMKPPLHSPYLARTPTRDMWEHYHHCICAIIRNSQQRRNWVFLGKPMMGEEMQRLKFPWRNRNLPTIFLLIVFLLELFPYLNSSRGNYLIYEAKTGHFRQICFSKINSFHEYYLQK